MTNKEIDLLWCGICFVYCLGWYYLLKWVM